MAMEVFPYFVFLQVFLTMIFSIGILQKCYILFSSKILRVTTTSTFLLFFGYLFIVSFTMTIYCIYVLVLWRPDTIIYNQHTLYMFGIVPWILLISNPIFQFSLCLERCLIVAFPHRYLNNYQHQMCGLVLCFVIAILTMNTFINDLWWLPVELPFECRYHSCIVAAIPRPYINTYKICLAVLEVIAAIALFILIKQKTMGLIGKGKAKNIVILVIVSTTVFFEFAPSIIDQIYESITGGQKLVKTIGPYRTCLSSLNIFISSVLYTRVFKKSRNKASTVQVLPTVS